MRRGNNKNSAKRVRTRSFARRQRRVLLSRARRRKSQQNGE